jgi:hypothetical protein
MSWKQAAGVLTVIFVITVMQAVFAAPLFELEGDLTSVGDLSNEHWNGEDLINGMFDSWFDMGLVAVFGVMFVSIARVVRKELTRQGKPP